ncbi:MAG: hypothetical protein RPU73_07930 [Candidatus Sedimenticola sp. (ex Thyasira tokunagai)]
MILTLSVQQFYLLLVSQNPHTVDYVNSKGKSKTIDIKKKSMYLATRWVGFLESIECRTGSSSGILTNLSESLNTFSKRGVFFDKVIKNAIVGYSPIAATSDLLKKKLLEEYYRQRQMQEVELGKLEKRGEELGKRGEELRKRGEELKKEHAALSALLSAIKAKLHDNDK